MPLPDFEMFANRLRKMARHHGKWARRKGVTCYRVYDADIPEFPLAIDIYEDCVHMAEYKRRHPLSDEEYRLWRSGCRQMVREVLEIEPEKVFFKERKRQKGTQQYERHDTRQSEQVVRENGLQFIVNLSDYLDTGLFLDHRQTRQMVRERAMGRRLLNLFAYTGSFTVYAAAGGAAASLTIDLSNTYLEWAKRNLALNHLDGPQHRFLRADVKQWLQEPVQETFDIIVLDPPTFSNSKAMRDILDTQRDHPLLINQCLERLRRDGILLFSTNYRQFKLNTEEIKSENIREITGQTVPPDFRNKRIHYCFEIKRPV